MKKIVLAAIFILGAISAMAQEWKYSEEFKTDFWTNQDKGMDFVDCNGIKYDAWNALYCTRKNGIGSVVRIGSEPKTSGLYDKVARGVAAQRPRNGHSSTTSSRSGSVGTHNYNTSDSHIEWMHNRQAQIQAAREEAYRKKKMEEQQRKIAEDNRAQAVTAQTNAMLQPRTNARIQRDHWHASQGAAIAQLRARKSMVKVGPNFDKMKPKSTGSQQAARLRGSNKPRRFMAANNIRNTVRKPLTEVQRPNSSPVQKIKKLQQALHSKQQYQQNARQAVVVKKNGTAQKKSTAAHYSKNGMLVLDEHAYSSLGKDWNGDGFKPLPPPPAPVTKIKRKMTQEEYHNLIVIEMIEQRPLTPSEKNYYDNLTF
jgi:hypothetical protein